MSFVFEGEGKEGHQWNQMFQTEVPDLGLGPIFALKIINNSKKL